MARLHNWSLSEAGARSSSNHERRGKARTAMGILDLKLGLFADAKPNHPDIGRHATDLVGYDCNAGFDRAGGVAIETHPAQWSFFPSRPVVDWRQGRTRPTRSANL
jgi:hypothetical protein